MKKLLLFIAIFISIGAFSQSARIRDLQTENSANANYFLVIDDPGWIRARKMSINVVTSLEAAARAAQDDIIEAGAGLATNGTYVVLTGSNFLTNADFVALGLTPNINNATFILDSMIALLYGSAGSCISYYVDSIYGCDSVYFDDEAKFLHTVRIEDDLVVGFRNGATGTNSMVLGSVNIASGSNTSAFGESNNVSGDDSYVFGYKQTLSGDYSLSGGYGNTANDARSITWGYNNTNQGRGAMCIGSGNTISADSLNMAIGRNHTIDGGNDNSCLGGVNNDINLATSSFENSIVGGSNNLIRNGASNVVSGGQNNEIYAANPSECNFIAGGEDNTIGAAAQPSNYCAIVGGQNHTMATATTVASAATIAGESSLNNGSYSVVAGGTNHDVDASADYSFIGGGYSHDVNSNYCGVLAGYDNTINSSTLYSTVIGGYQLTADRDTTTYVHHLDVYGTKVHQPSSYLTMSNSESLNPYTTYLRVVGNGGAVTACNVAAGTSGQLIYIMGTDDTNTVRFDDGGNLALAGGANFVMGLGDMLTLIYDGDEGLWFEISRSDN